MPEPVLLVIGDADQDGALVRVERAQRAVVGWSTGTEPDDQPRFAAAPAFAPQTLITERRSTLTGVVAGPRGDVLAAWQTNAWAYSHGPRELHVMLQRPGATFAPPVSLGRFAADPSTLSLAADGTRAAAWNAGSDARRGWSSAHSGSTAPGAHPARCRARTCGSLPHPAVA
jgi:hypothetical protein